VKTIRLYRHPDCHKCARLARRHQRLDWLRRLEVTTDMPPTGPLRMGEIAVQDLRTGALMKGADCFELLFRHIPAYWPLLPLLHIPFVREHAQREASGADEARDWIVR
jgi:hypothetical protein